MTTIQLVGTNRRYYDFYGYKFETWPTLLSKTWPTLLSKYKRKWISFIIIIIIIIIIITKIKFIV